MKTLQFLMRGIILSLVFFSQNLFSLELSPVFRDHAVLQRNENIRIYGWSEPNTKIELIIFDKKRKTKSDSNGKWAIGIGTHPASGPFQMTISSSKEKITLNDLYFGDVWLASGQSNMEWKLEWGVNNWKQEVANSDLPLIRYFDVVNDYRSLPQERIKNPQWVLSNSKRAGKFSAVAWLFGKKVQADQGIAIGIIDSTWGGTPAEAWTPAQSLLKTSFYKKETRELLSNTKSWTKKFEVEKKRSRTKERLVTSREGATLKKLADPKFNHSTWPTIALPNDKEIDGITWLRQTFNLRNVPKKPVTATLGFGQTPKVIQIYINNTFIGDKTSEVDVERFQFNSNILKKGTNLIALRVLNPWSNKVRVGKKNNFQISFNQTTISLEGNWHYSSSVEDQFPPIAGHWRKPSVLYNAMIHPLIGFPLKGVIWYQGESNINRAQHYHELFSQLIISWREKWQQPQLPFLFVQLASMHPRSEFPKESKWAQLREAQTQTLAVPYTGMAVAIDAGDTRDIHPRNKQVIADRLWAAARVQAYRKTGVYSGPTATSIETHEDRLTVNFDNAGKGLTANGTLIGFELADDSGIYVNAKAIIKGTSVILSSELKNPPKSVRYGWADNSPANLYNMEGLPAVPFRMGEKHGK